MTELVCGHLATKEISEIADAAARRVIETSQRRAVCLSPEGRVTVETLGVCVDDDIVGVYTKAPDLMALWRQIEGDLREAARERGLRPKAPKRRVVKSEGGRRAA